MAKNRKQEFVFKGNFLKKLSAIADEQPTALSLYFKLLTNVNQYPRFINGVSIEKGQIALKYKTEKKFFNTSKNRFRRDRYYLIQKGLISSFRDGLTTIMTVNDYDSLTNQCE